MERRKFEESWKEAFDQAAFSPSDNVWTNVELTLEKEKGARLKRRLFFYQSLAAACVVFALSVGIYVLNNNTVPAQQLASHAATELNRDKIATPDAAVTPSASDPVNTKTDGTTTIDDLESSSSAQNNVAAAKTLSAATTSKATANTTHTGNNMNALAGAPLREEKDVDAVFAPMPERELPVLAEVGEIGLHLPQQTPAADPVALMMARLNQREREIAEEEKSEKKNAEKYRNENLWTSLGFSAGPFSTVNSGSDVPPPPPPSFNPESNALMANNAALATVAEKEAKASGITYSLGVNLGAKLTERWVLQGGVNYMGQSSQYTQEYLIGNTDNSQMRPANYDDFRKTTSSQTSDAAPENLIRSAPYDVNNNVSFLSIPLQAGYMIINRDFGLQLNAGVSTDVFLQSTTEATANGDQVKVDPSTAGFGENSAFRPVNLSGLMGTELSYKVGEHYRISVNPGLRYPFNSIYKSDAYNTTRISFDLGLRFRYIFH